MSVFQLKATKTVEGGYAKAPPGNHLAALVAIVDMGTHETEYQGVKKWQRKVYCAWELVAEQVAGTNRNHVVACDLTLSLNEKAKLRKWIEARTGKPIPNGGDYDLLSELGQKCLLSVINKDGYPKVEGMAAPVKGVPVPDPQTQPFAWSLSDYERDGVVNLPDWLPWYYGHPVAETIMACREIAGDRGTLATGSTPHLGGGATADPDAPIPF